MPPALLAEGRHELMLRVGAAGYDGATLSTVQVGPVRIMESLQESRTRLLWSRGMVIGGGGLLPTWVWFRSWIASSFGI